MKCLSVHQPWADLIIDRGRPEIRCWDTKYRGKLLIHAGLKVEHQECRRLGLIPGARGAILGVVELVGIEQLNARRWEELRKQTLEAGELCYGDKTFAWFFKNHKRFPESIPFKGKLGIFDVPDGLVLAVIKKVETCC